MNNKEKHEKAIKDLYHYLTEKYGPGIKRGNNPNWDLELENGVRIKIFAIFSPTPRVKVQRGFTPDTDIVYVFYRPAKNRLGFSATAEHGHDVANAMIHFRENNGPSNIDTSMLKGRVIDKVIASHMEETGAPGTITNNHSTTRDQSPQSDDMPIEHILPSWRNRERPRPPKKKDRPTTLEPPNATELETIGNEIECHYATMVSRFDRDKYPDEPYNRMIDTFSGKKLPNNEIENALKWKWGHWKKVNYPKAHKQLIKHIERIWPSYVAAGCTNPRATFDYWRKALEKRQRYITNAFITHLVHPDEAPIMDQHNYRAMNCLLSIAGRKIDQKRRPSNWIDIVNMKIFLDALTAIMNKNRRDLDRFLMMYGRHIAAR